MPVMFKKNARFKALLKSLVNQRYPDIYLFNK